MVHTTAEALEDYRGQLPFQVQDGPEGVVPRGVASAAVRRFYMVFHGVLVYSNAKYKTVLVRNFLPRSRREEINRGRKELLEIPGTSTLWWEQPCLLRRFRLRIRLGWEAR